MCAHDQNKLTDWGRPPPKHTYLKKGVGVYPDEDTDTSSHGVGDEVREQTRVYTNLHEQVRTYTYVRSPYMCRDGTYTCTFT